jgi:hypothetical protein
MNIEKIAAKDAAQWAAAEMFFGKGAGTRRKLLSADIASKVENVFGYHEAFNKAYSEQDFAKHAMKAIQERNHIDRTEMIGKNVKGILRGDRRSMSTGVLILVGIGVVAHQTGYDEVALKEAKKYYKKAKDEIKARQFAHNIKKTYTPKGN